MENTALCVGAYVVYGLNGVCRIDSVSRMKFTGDRVGRMYYVLKPLGNPKSTLFLPMDSECVRTKVRSVMTKEEINALLVSLQGEDLTWDDDRRQRTERFQQICAGGIMRELILMLRCLYSKKQELLSRNKKLSMTDENTLKTAERLIKEEFSFSLGIDSGDVDGYIRSIMK